MGFKSITNYLSSYIILTTVMSTRYEYVFFIYGTSKLINSVFIHLLFSQNLIVCLNHDLGVP